MSFIPHPEDLPEGVRKKLRFFVPTAFRHHCVQYWQHIAEFNGFWTPEFRSNKARLSGLNRQHSNKPCVIMGNGPSLAETDFKLLENVFTFGLNRGYLLWAERGFTPDMFVAVNDLIVEQFHREISQIACPKVLPWRRRGLFRDAEDCLFLQQSWTPRFVSDITQGVWSGGTVTFSAIQIAYYMGFNPVILIGVDHSYVYKGQPNEEVVSKANDPNHFDNRYFGPGIRWNLPDLERSESAYRFAKAAFANAGRQILNATDGGKLEIFDRVDLKTALKGWQVVE